MGRESVDTDALREDAYQEGQAYAYSVADLDLRDHSVVAVRYADALVELELVSDRALSALEGAWVEPETVLASEVEDTKAVIARLEEMEFPAPRFKAHRDAYVRDAKACLLILEAALTEFKRGDTAGGEALAGPYVSCHVDMRERGSDIAYK